MDSWINQQTGSDILAYIGILLAIAGLIFGGAKIKTQKKQTQKNGNNSTNIQGGRDVKIGSEKN